MKFSLRSKLSISYILVTLLLLAGISLFMNVLLEKQFKGYIIKQQEQRNKNFVSLVGNQYDSFKGWNTVVIENIGVNALEQGMIMKVRDAAGKTVWDATVHNNGLCVQMISHMSHNMNSHYPNFKGGYVENKYPLRVELKDVGSVEIGYYGPYYFNDNDLAFISSLNQILVVTGILSLLFALILGAFMARRISKPISRVVSASVEISKGNFSERITEHSSTKEMIQLTGSINHLAETMEKQEALRKKVAADVSHELRTPLATLQSHMEAMIDGIWQPEVARLKSCHEEIMRINRMVGDMEKLARVEGENLTLHAAVFDLSALVRSILQNFESDFNNKGILLNFVGEETSIMADKDKISQVVINLVSNALKYTAAGGAVEVQIDETEDNTVIIVRDTGDGISAEDLPHIFERFFRADKSRSRLTGGAGIGLAITKAIVEAHKGKIEVESEMKKGTEFKVLIPK